MLFPYQYVSHQIEKMQGFIDFIFEVWCKAPTGIPFSLELFNDNVELKEVMQAFHDSDANGANFFNSHVESIYNLFFKLTPEQIEQFKQWYQANNDIEKACANDSTIQIVRYTDIKAVYPDLSQQLESFFKGLYSKDLLNLVALKKKIGQIDSHYQNFMTVNNAGKCPFCGINDMKGINHSKREPYDHYLPKALYPFNSINFRNLAPVCHECNSTYKLTNDPVHSSVGRRKAFYPFSSTNHKIVITITLSKSDIEHLKPPDVQLTFEPSAISEEIETWKDVYGIEERYKAKCCSNDAKDWLEQVRTLHDLGKKPKESLAMVRQQAEKDPISNSNFLKIAFLEGCHRIGMWT
jgi:hypothetical protein